MRALLPAPTYLGSLAATPSWLQRLASLSGLMPYGLPPVALHDPCLVIWTSKMAQVPVAFFHPQEECKLHLLAEHGPVQSTHATVFAKPALPYDSHC